MLVYENGNRRSMNRSAEFERIQPPRLAHLFSEPPSFTSPVTRTSFERFTGSNNPEMESNTISTSDQRLLALGYRPEFRREMSLFGVVGISFCAIGILTGMSSAFQTGLFSGGPLGLFWGWNVSWGTRTSCIENNVLVRQVCSLFMFFIALGLAEICSS